MNLLEAAKMVALDSGDYHETQRAIDLLWENKTIGGNDETAADVAMRTLAEEIKKLEMDNADWMAAAKNHATMRTYWSQRAEGAEKALVALREERNDLRDMLAVAQVELAKLSGPSSFVISTEQMQEWLKMEAELTSAQGERDAANQHCKILNDSNRQLHETLRRASAQMAENAALREEVERLKTTLKEINNEAAHYIPFYAYGDNEAACDMADRLEWIEQKSKIL